MVIFLSIGFAFLLGVISEGHAYDWYSYNGHYYTLTNSWETWTEAETEAVSLGGHLVTINDDAENIWLTNTFKDTYNRQFFGNSWQNIAWIGYYKSSNDWQWISGEPVTFYRHDYPGWPQGGDHAYLHLAYHPFYETWNANPLHDTNYSYNPKGIIESLSLPVVVPLPSSYLLLGSVTLGIGISGYRHQR